MRTQELQLEGRSKGRDRKRAEAPSLSPSKSKAFSRQKPQEAAEEVVQAQAWIHETWLWIPVLPPTWSPSVTLSKPLQALVSYSTN